MPTQIVMDRTGDTRHKFEVGNDADVKAAMDRFAELTKSGYKAVEPGKNGEPGRVVNKFDPNVETTIFVPQLQGG